METATLNKVDNSIYDLYGERWYTANDDPVALLRAQSRTEIPWVLGKIGDHFLQSSLSVLDVGCGGGFFTNAFAKRGFDVTGIDSSTESLTTAARHDRTGRVRYLTADAEHLPFPDRSFDVVTAMDFLEHVEDPGRVVHECARVLKPGGLFFFHTFNRNPVAGFVVIKLVEWFVRNTPRHMHVLRLFITPEEMTALCTESGLTIREIVGLRPRLSGDLLKIGLTGVVPESLNFKIVDSTLISYMGYAKVPAQ